MLSFSKKLIEYADTQSFSKLITEYLTTPDHFAEFTSFNYDSNTFSEAIRKRKEISTNRQLVREVIAGQYGKVSGKISYSADVEKNISLLAEPTTFTVATGHQLNIFTGPLYFIYKIISTINLAVQLKVTHPDCNFIPVYWLASEDHDLEEINHIHLFGKRIEWKPVQQGAAGRIKCTGLSEVVNLVKEMLGHDPKTENIISRLFTAYDEQNNLSEATRILVHELFAVYGLVILDADDARLKKLFIEEMKDDVMNHSAFRLVGETIQELEKKYKAQVHPRETNLFYLGENYRERIVDENGNYVVLNTDLKFTRQELLHELETHPEKFSPNVVLRPLYQEKILPNLAYVGGPAEISYWLEYRKMFEFYKANLPVLVLRECVMIIDAGMRDRLIKLGLSPEDIFMKEEDLVKKYLMLKSGQEYSIDALLHRTESLFDETIRQVNEIDSTLKAAVEAEHQKVNKSLRMLEEKIRRAEKRKHETAIHQIQKLKEKLFPENNLQERYENLLTYYSKYGPDFLKILMNHLIPFEKKFILLIEE